MIHNISTILIENEKKDNTSIVRNLMKSIEEKGKFRDAQLEAIRIYLWLKEKYNCKNVIKKKKKKNTLSYFIFYKI